MNITQKKENFKEKKFSNFDKIICILVSSLFILNNGIYSSLVPPGIPIGIIGEAILFPILFYYLYLNKIKFNLIFIAILFLNIQTIFSIYTSFQLYGIQTLRSATYIADLNYIFVGSVIAQDNIKRLFVPQVIWKILYIGSIYALLIPFVPLLINFSPVLPNFSGYSNTLFFNYQTSNLISYTFLFSQYFFPLKKINSTSKVISLISAFIITVFRSKRNNFSILLFNLFYVFFTNPKKIGKYLFFFIIFLAFLNLYFLLGFNFQGTTFSQIQGLDFFYKQFLSSFGIRSDAFSGAADGLYLRLDWWTNAFENLTSSFYTLVFGLGQGIPLTDFFSSQGVLVKDLHNSFLNILVRNGVVGFIVFIILYINLFKNLFHNILVSKNYPICCNFYRTSFIFAASTLITSLTQNSLEISFIAIPFYFLLGLVGSYKLKPN